MKKLVFLFFLIVLLTGCENNRVLMCTLTTKDDNHTNDYILNATFKNNNLEMMSLTGTSIYNDSNSTKAAYDIVKEGYDQLSNDIDNSIKTEVYYINDKVYFKMRLYPNELNDNGKKYLQDIFSIDDSNPTYNDFIVYTKANNYVCD